MVIEVLVYIFLVVQEETFQSQPEFGSLKLAHGDFMDNKLIYNRVPHESKRKLIKRLISGGRKFIQER